MTHVSSSDDLLTASPARGPAEGLIVQRYRLFLDEVEKEAAPLTVFRLDETLLSRLMETVAQLPHEGGMLNLAAGIDLANGFFVMARTPSISHYMLRLELERAFSGTPPEYLKLAVVHSQDREGVRIFTLEQDLLSNLFKHFGWFRNAAEGFIDLMPKPALALASVEPESPRPADVFVAAPSLQERVEVTLLHSLGLHARVAGMLVQLSRRFADTSLEISAPDTRSIVIGSSIIRLMTLGVKRGERIFFQADGPHAADVMRELLALKLLGPIFERTIPAIAAPLPSGGEAAVSLSADAAMDPVPAVFDEAEIADAEARCPFLQMIAAGGLGAFRLARI